MIYKDSRKVSWNATKKKVKLICASNAGNAKGEMKWPIFFVLRYRAFSRAHFVSFAFFFFFLDLFYNQDSPLLFSFSRDISSTPHTLPPILSLSGVFELLTG